ncbi:MAG: hypothetical protein COB26_05870 [Piscirickettsiaceae bacterium]|nr:MAG: hypothetical protein COB89_02160 [Piscirickettsiaceae bacterium]PCI69484.1 MAG: hypothetical protein COB26_05870 [Piscirickettsiaceae bacterium]
MNRFINIFALGLLCLALNACQYESQSDKTWTHDEAGLLTASFSADGSLALVSATNGAARLIDVQTNKAIHQWQHTDSNSGIIKTAISANNKFAITAERNSLALWEVTSGKIIGYWDFPSITDIAISANGLSAVIGMESNKAYYFDLYHGKIIHTLTHDGFVNTVALSRNNRFIMTGGNDQYAKLWSIKTGDLVQQWRQNFKIYDVLLSDDGDYAMSNASLGKTKIWSTESGKMISQLPMRYMTVSASAFSADANTLLTGRPNQRIDLWDVKTGTLLNTWLPPKSFLLSRDTFAIIAVAFAGDDQSFVSENSKGIAKQWHITKK